MEQNTSTLLRLNSCTWTQILVVVELQKQARAWISPGLDVLYTKHVCSLWI